MLNLSSTGQIVVLNGAPRSGKSSIAKVMQDTFDELWMNLGVDGFMRMTPQRYLPGIGLRPGGERPDLEPIVETLYKAMYESIAAHSRLGINVVVDVGHHDLYRTRRSIISSCANILRGLPVLFVGVRCPMEVIMERRIATWNVGFADDGSVPEPVILWQNSVHQHGAYDLEVDTSVLTSEECAKVIKERLESGPPGTAFHRLAGSSRPHPD